jgi:hypothetical protein
VSMPALESTYPPVQCVTDYLTQQVKRQVTYIQCRRLKETGATPLQQGQGTQWAAVSILCFTRK